MDNATLLDTAWAITPQKLKELASYDLSKLADPVETWRAESEQAADKKYKDVVADFLSRFEEDLHIEDGVATLDISGPLMTNPGPAERYFFGAADMVRIGSLIREAAANDKVHTLHLNINSPGGTVTGTPEVAAAIQEFNATGKESAAFTNDMMASAAFWIGSQCKRLCASESAVVGSIGVLRPHVSLEKARSDAGIEVTIFTAGKHKAAGAYNTSLTEEQADRIQAEVDAIHEQFKAAVNKQRSVNEADCDGSVFRGTEAALKGLIDHVAIDITIGSAIKSITGATASVDSTSEEMNTEAVQEPVEDEKIEDQVEETSETASVPEETVETDESTESAETPVEDDQADESDDSAFDSRAAEAAGDDAEAEGEEEAASPEMEEQVATLEASLGQKVLEIERLTARIEALEGEVEEAKQSAGREAAEIATQSGVDAEEAAQVTENGEEGLEEASYAAMDMEQLWQKHGEIKEKEGNAAATAFYDGRGCARRHW